MHAEWLDTFRWTHESLGDHQNPALDMYPLLPERLINDNCCNEPQHLVGEKRIGCVVGFEVNVMDNSLTLGARVVSKV